MNVKGRARKAESPDLPVRERLLNSASRLFYKEGVQAVGIDRLLEDAGSAKASLYSNFGSKDALIAAYLERQAAAARARIEEWLRAFEGPKAARVLKFFDLLSEWTREKDYRGCPFQNASSELTDPGHPARAVIEEQRAWLVNLMKRLVLEAGVRPAEPLTQALVVLYDGAVASTLIHRTGAGPRAARWAAERLLSAALAAPDRTH
jgi:AcrR family transcriptional regulator